MTASSRLPKKASAQIPYCGDQGMDYLAGAGKAGVSVQLGNTTSAAVAPLTFASMGLPDMADTNYHVSSQNYTSAARKATITNKLTTGFTTTSPNAADLQTYLIVGRIAGQLGPDGL